MGQLGSSCRKGRFSTRPMAVFVVLALPVGVAVGGKSLAGAVAATGASPPTGAMHDGGLLEAQDASLAGAPDASSRGGPSGVLDGGTRLGSADAESDAGVGLRELDADSQDVGRGSPAVAAPVVPPTPPAGPIPEPAPPAVVRGEDPSAPAGADNKLARPHAIRGKLGLGLDAGLSGPLPDGGLLVAVRPMSWSLLQLGVGYNGLSYGIRGGITFINPFVIPLSVTCEGGHYFEGNANNVARWAGLNATDLKPLERFSYDYVNLLGGITTRGRRFSFYLRGGVTWLRATFKDFGPTVTETTQVPVDATDPRVRYRGPTAKLGVACFF